MNAVVQSVTLQENTNTGAQPRRHVAPQVRRGDPLLVVVGASVPSAVELALYAEQTESPF